MRIEKKKKKKKRVAANFGDFLIIFLPFVGFEEASSYWSFQYFSVFLWSPSIGELCITPLSFVKTTESYVGIFHWSPSIGKPRMTLVSFVKTME